MFLSNRNQSFAMKINSLLTVSMLSGAKITAEIYETQRTKGFVYFPNSSPQNISHEVNISNDPIGFTQSC